MTSLLVAILFFILGYISAYFVKIKVGDKNKDVIQDAVEEFKRLEREEKGEFINVRQADIKNKLEKGELTVDDIIDEDI